MLKEREMARSNALGSKVIAGIVAGALAISPVSGAWAQAAAHPSTSQAAVVPAPTAAELASAKKHYAEGEKKFKAGDFAGALPEFVSANEVKSTAQAERYIGLCEDSLGHYARAAEWYEKFLAHVPDKLAAAGEEARKRLSEIRAMKVKVHIASNPPGASVAIDDEAVPGATPLDADLSPGHHRVKLTAQGRLPAEKAIDLALGTTQTVSADLEAEPPPAPPPVPVVAAVPAPAPMPVAPPPPEPRSKLPAFITGGLAVAAAAVGTVFGVMALNDKSNFDKNPTTATADDGDTHSLIADMAFGIAITFGVTSAVLFLTKDEPPAATSSTTSSPRTAESASVRAASALTVTPTPIVGPHSGGAGVLVRF